jgi:hypothetical protein
LVTVRDGSCTTATDAPSSAAAPWLVVTEAVLSMLWPGSTMPPLSMSACVTVYDAV